jgi:hypothetical protein
MNKKIDVDSYIPYLTDNDIDKIVDEIVEIIDVYNQDSLHVELECKNGYVIEVDVYYTGFNYRIIKLKNVEMYALNNNVIDNLIDDFKCVIQDTLWDKIYELNNNEEIEYDITRKET